MPNESRSLPEIRPVPDGPDGKRIALIVIAIAVVGGLLVFGGLMLLGQKRTSPEEETRRLEPAQETHVATMPVLPGTEPSGSAGATASPGASTTPPAGSAGAGVDRVAYRLGETLYVANDDGTQARSVARVAEGEYALSPDGRTLAVSHDAKLTLYDALTGSPSQAGAAAAERPVWLPDSSAVLFVRSASGSDGCRTEVWRVKRDGIGARLLRRGGAPCISPDGRTVAVLGASGLDSHGYDTLFVARDGSGFRSIRVSQGTPVSAALSNDRIYYSVTGADGDSCIDSCRLDGSDRILFSARPEEAMQATWDELMMSPNGRVLAAAAIGDDQFSRVSLFPLPKGTVAHASRRRDCYLRAWTRSGDCLLLVEGNAYQGQSTGLVCVTADGSIGKSIVTGAR